MSFKYVVTVVLNYEKNAPTKITKITLFTNQYE